MVVIPPSNRAGHVAIRTCIGCRERGPAEQMLRVVAGPTVSSETTGSAGAFRAVLPDPRRRTSGRGAWLHLTPDCVALAERRRAFGRSLRLTMPVDPAAIRAYLEIHKSTQEMS